MIIVANWKMNKDLTETRLFWEDFENKITLDSDFLLQKENILIAPSFPFLHHFQTKCSEKISVVAQNCHHDNSGAYTGEVSVKMLNSIGVKYVIIGHSERRMHFNEKDDILKKKINLCLENNLCPIVCFGETHEDRALNNHLSVIEHQLNIIPVEGNKKIILAYEPIWAIGSGKTPSIKEIEEVHSYVKGLYNLPVLYGGSLNEKNANDILCLPEVDGGLIGGASLLSDTFFSILKVANNIMRSKI